MNSNNKQITSDKPVRRSSTSFRRRSLAVLFKRSDKSKPTDKETLTKVDVTEQKAQDKLDRKNKRKSVVYDRAALQARLNEGGVFI
jgi:hypothetical protein